jgi:hypothetical protein
VRAREALSRAGLGAIIWAAVDTGEITAEEAPLLVRSLLSAGLDTTIVSIGNALYAFATNPGQWQALRESPALVRPAFAAKSKHQSNRGEVTTAHRSRPGNAHTSDLNSLIDLAIIAYYEKGQHHRSQEPPQRPH